MTFFAANRFIPEGGGGGGGGGAVGRGEGGCGAPSGGGALILDQQSPFFLQSVSDRNSLISIYDRA